MKFEDLNPSTRFQRMHEIDIRLERDGQVYVACGGVSGTYGPHALAILDVFSTPRLLAEAVRLLELRVQGGQARLNVMADLTQMIQDGFVRDPLQGKPENASIGYTFDTPQMHLNMLSDRDRTSRFIAALREVVRPGDIVLDIGTGSGVLAIAAAQAGAAHVYAIEGTPIADVAEQMFAANGVADRITLIRGWSTDVELPRRADVLVSEVIGDNPLGENALEVMADALKRHLVPNPRLIPSRLRICGVAFELPDASIARFKFMPETVDRFRNWYGVDFTPMCKLQQSVDTSFWARPQSAREWDTIGEPIVFADFDFALPNSAGIESTGIVTAAVKSRLNGFMTYFEAELSPSQLLSMHPNCVTEDNHWDSLFFLPPAPFELAAGESVRVTYRYRQEAGQSMIRMSRA